MILFDIWIMLDLCVENVIMKSVKFQDLTPSLGGFTA
jgi:hypothetical protein